MIKVSLPGVISSDYYPIVQHFKGVYKAQVYISIWELVEYSRWIVTGRPVFHETWHELNWWNLTKRNKLAARHGIRLVIHDTHMHLERSSRIAEYHRPEPEIFNPIISDDGLTFAVQSVTNLYIYDIDD